MKTLLLGMLAGSLLVNPAHAYLYELNATFKPIAESPYFDLPATVTGTVEITNGLVTAGGFDVPGFSHFNLAFFSVRPDQPTVQGLDARQFPGSYLGQDLLSMSFMPEPYSTMADMRTADILFGYIFHYTTANASAGRYWGTNFSGSITCAEAACQFSHVPSPVLGAGLPGLVVLGLLSWWRRRPKSQSQ